MSRKTRTTSEAMALHEIHNAYLLGCARCVARQLAAAKGTVNICEVHDEMVARGIVEDVPTDRLKGPVLRWHGAVFLNKRVWEWTGNRAPRTNKKRNVHAGDTVKEWRLREGADASVYASMPAAPSSDPIVPGERPSDACDLVIMFHSKRAREHFARWLRGSGEQQYWEWMECRETEESGDITVEFHYHPIVRPDLPKDDAARYGEFIADGIVRTRVMQRRRDVDTERNLALGIVDPGNCERPQ